MPSGHAWRADRGRAATGVRRLRLGGEEVEVEVRVSSRARQIRLRVLPGRRPEVVVPRGASPADVERAVSEGSGWLERALARLRARSGDGRTLGLDRPATVWVGMRPLAIETAGGRRPVARLAPEGDRLLVSGPAEEAAPAIDRWYRRHAADLLEADVARAAAELGVRPRRISIRDQRSRWGSCSARGTLSFSWRLAIVPPEVRRYVAIHETCHLRRLDHSPHFWRLVARQAPDHREHVSWLHSHADEVMGWAPRPAGDAGDGAGTVADRG